MAASIKAVLALLPSILRAALLWFKLRNHLAYVQSLRSLDDSIAVLEGRHRSARDNGDSDAAVRLLYEADDARASREALSAAYLELAGGQPHPDSTGNLYADHFGDVAQPAIPRRP